MLSSGPLDFAWWQLALDPLHLEVALVHGGVHCPTEIARATWVPSDMAIARGLNVGRQWPKASVPIGGGGACQTHPLVVNLAQAIVHPKLHTTDGDESMLPHGRNYLLLQAQILLLLCANKGQGNE